MSIETMQKALGTAFGGKAGLSALPGGLAVSTALEDGSGDRIGFLVVQDGDGYRLEDDGDWLAHLVASGVDLSQGRPAGILADILSQADASWNPATYEIWTSGVPGHMLGEASVRFARALKKLRDAGFIPVSG